MKPFVDGIHYYFLDYQAAVKFMIKEECFVGWSYSSKF